MQSVLSGCSTVDEVRCGRSPLPMTALRGVIIIRDCEMDICARLNSFEKQMNFHTLRSGVSHEPSNDLLQGKTRIEHPSLTVYG